MKEIKLYIGIIAVLLTTMLTACSDSMVDNDPSTTSETEEGYYKASFRIAIPSFEENATRSTVFLNEGIRNKDAMKLFCFDNKGQFVGLGKIQDFTAVLGFKRENDGNYYEVDENGNHTGTGTWLVPNRFHQSAGKPSKRYDHRHPFLQRELQRQTSFRWILRRRSTNHHADSIRHLFC